MSNKDWSRIIEMLEHLNTGSFSSWQRTHDKLKRLLKEDLKSQFDKAVAHEKKSHFSNAERVWKDLMETPQELLPSNYTVYAEEFFARRDKGLLKRRRILCILLSIVLLVFWAYPAAPAVYGILQGFASDTLDLAGAIDTYRLFVLQFAAFALVLIGGFVFPQVRRDNPFQYLPRMSPRVVCLGMLAILSPLAVIFSQMLRFYLPEYLSFMPSSEGAILVYIGLLWVLVDLAGQNGVRSPAAFAFALSWAVAVGLAISGIHPALSKDWPILGGLQLAVYLLIHIGQAVVCKIMRKPEQGGGSNRESFVADAK
jgi:hypothetical protein